MNLIEKAKLSYNFWLGRKLPDCDQATRMISESMERSLSFKQRIMLRLHLHICAMCRHYQKQVMLLRKAFRKESSPIQDGTAGSQSTLSPEARDRIKSSLDRQQG